MKKYTEEELDHKITIAATESATEAIKNFKKEVDHHIVDEKADRVNDKQELKKKEKKGNTTSKNA